MVGRLGKGAATMMMGALGVITREYLQAVRLLVVWSPPAPLWVALCPRCSELTLQEELAPSEGSWRAI